MVVGSRIGGAGRKKKSKVLVIRRTAGGVMRWGGVHKRGEDRKRKGGNFFNVSGSRPAGVSRLSWLCKLPRERWSAEGRTGGDEGLR